MLAKFSSIVPLACLLSISWYSSTLTVLWSRGTVKLFNFFDPVSMRTTDLKKRLDRTSYCLLAPGYFDRRHLDETTLLATALDLRSEDYESKTWKPLVENPCCSASHRCFIDTFTNWGLAAKWSHQDGRRKFLCFKNETIEARSVITTYVRTSRPVQPVRKTTPSVPPNWKLLLAKLYPSLEG